MWEGQNEEFRDPAEIVAYWQGAHSIDSQLLEFETQGKWWETLLDLDITLLVTREYEHLLLCMSVDHATGPVTSLMRLPHPSGLAVDREQASGSRGQHAESQSDIRLCAVAHRITPTTTKIITNWIIGIVFLLLSYAINFLPVSVYIRFQCVKPTGNVCSLLWRGISAFIRHPQIITPDGV